MKIVAIGGGEIGRLGYPIETTKIDKEIISLTGKKNPRLLFIPTASSDSESYFAVVEKYFGKKLLRIAPLHHHFEAIGWPGYKVVMRYWVLSIVFAFLGVIIALAAL